MNTYGIKEQDGKLADELTISAEARAAVSRKCCRRYKVSKADEHYARVTERKVTAVDNCD